MPQLVESRRKQLDGIVSQMEANGEPDDAIKSVVADFSKKYDAGGDLLVDNLKNIGGFLRSGLRSAAQHPVQTGALIGAGLAVPFTGGGSLAIPAALVGPSAAALGGAGGAGLGMMYGAASGTSKDAIPPTPGGVIKGMAQQGAIQGITEGGGALAQKGLQMAGRGLYRTAARFPANLTEKYGDLIGAGLREKAPIGASRTVQDRMLASKGAVDTLANDATAAGRSVPREAMTSRYGDLVEQAGKNERLGVRGEVDEIADREMAITRANPAQMTPTDALGLKRSADTLADTAQKQIQRGAAVKDMTVKLHDATRGGLNEGLESATHGLTTSQGLSYGKQNARTKELFGLSRGLRKAEQRPHALTNLATVGTGVAAATNSGGESYQQGAQSGVTGALIMRALLSPSVQSRAGIAANVASQVPAAQLIRAALLARMTQDNP